MCISRASIEHVLHSSDGVLLRMADSLEVPVSGKTFTVFFSNTVLYGCGNGHELIDRLLEGFIDVLYSAKDSVYLE